MGGTGGRGRGGLEGKVQHKEIGDERCVLQLSVLRGGLVTSGPSLTGLIMKLRRSETGGETAQTGFHTRQGFNV